jgi:hypothetical protein
MDREGHTASADTLVWGAVLLQAAVLCLKVRFGFIVSLADVLTSGLVLVSHCDDVGLV